MKKTPQYNKQDCFEYIAFSQQCTRIYMCYAAFFFIDKTMQNLIAQYVSQISSSDDRQKIISKQMMRLSVSL